MNNLINILKKNEIYPMYVIKKVFKSKNNYCYQFNQNGFAVAISVNKSKIKTENLDALKIIYLRKNIRLICPKLMKSL